MIHTRRCPGSTLARGGFAARLTAEGERSPISRLVPGREPNRELWSALPGMEWFSPTLGAKPGAAALAVLPEDLAAGRLVRPAHEIPGAKMRPNCLVPWAWEGVR